MKLSFITFFLLMLLACSAEESIVVEGVIKPDTERELYILQNNILSLDAYSGKNVISAKCSCFDECLDTYRCEWVIKRYNHLLEKLPEPLTHLKTHGIATLNVIDGGHYGCLSVVNNKEGIALKTDVQFYKNDDALSDKDFKVKMLEPAHSLVISEDESCLWTLDN